MNKTIESWRGGLIVSCQAPAESPLNRPEIIAAFAEAAALGGAVGVRIDAPENVRAVRARVALPLLGIHKIISERSDVYITPTFEAAKNIVEAGADIIALDATRRARPGGETLENIARRARRELNRPLMADIALYDEGVYAAETLGIEVVSTTLSGYTPETKHMTQPDFDLVERLAKRLTVPIICEGRLRTTADVRRSFDCGAHAVVVGGAITGVDFLIRKFVGATATAS